MSVLLGRNVPNADKLVIKKWPECLGIDIEATSVYNIHKGVVVYVGQSTDGKYVVNVQLDATRIVRYCNLKTEYVSPNQAILEGVKIGEADKYVRVEYCASSLPTNDKTQCIRVGASSYYKYNPYNLLCGNGKIEITGVCAYDRAQSGLAYDPTQLINHESITPYIATIHKSVNSVDVAKLKSQGVVGLMLYGGGLYDEVHMKKDRYTNSNLNSLVLQCIKHSMPYGLYVDVRARSIEEAKLECKQLQLVISKYIPILGVWLNIQLTKPTSINDKILDIYRDQLTRWGLSERFGIYASKSQLSKITWSKHQKSFYLWLVNHVGRIDSIDSLLTPEFFKL